MTAGPPRRMEQHAPARNRRSSHARLPVGYFFSSWRSFPGLQALPGLDTGMRG
jgi:hypothetical protein